MSRALEPVSRAGRVLFELDRFELVDDRYELTGRWSGVRGRRFIRPTLMLIDEGHPVRLLADLTHKPWAAEDGEPWEAAFPCRITPGEVQEAELSVAPDITVALATPGPGSRRSARKPARASGPRPAPARPAEPSARPDHGEQHRLKAALERADTAKRQTAGRIDELLGQLSQAMRERDEGQARRNELESDLEALRQERDELSDDRDAVRKQRDDLAANHAAAVRSRDEALAASEAAGNARDEAQAQRGGAISARAQAESASQNAAAAQSRAEIERDDALALRDHALADRDAALVARDDALVERQAALAERDEAFRERDSYRAALAQHQSLEAHDASTRGAAMVMRRAVQEPPAFRQAPSMLPRAMAVIVLLAIGVALLIVLHVA